MLRSVLLTPMESEKGHLRCQNTGKTGESFENADRLVLATEGCGVINREFKWIIVGEALERVADIQKHAGFRKELIERLKLSADA